MKKTNRTLKMGGYSLIVTAIVIALVIAVNAVMAVLPSGFTEFDMTDESIYTLSGQTKDLVTALDKEVSIYLIAEDGEEDIQIETLVNKYGELSENVSVKKVDPAVDSTFVSQYTTQAVPQNSIIVECGTKSRVISNSEIVKPEIDMELYYSTGQQIAKSYSFEGENALTSAIASVTDEDLPKIYALNNHGEQALSQKMLSLLQTDNVEQVETSLIKEGGVPEDADCVLINAPMEDISADEADMLIDYLEKGGRLMLITSYVFDQDTDAAMDMSNLYSVMQTYGCALEEGYVIEGSSGAYYQTPDIILPSIAAHEITQPSIDAGANVLMAMAQGIKVDSDIRSSVKVSSLLSTSTSSYSKVEIPFTTYEKAEEDIAGPFSLGVAVEEDYDNVNTKLVWFSSAYIVEDEFDNAVGGANSDLFRNSLAWLVDEEESISIRAKSMNTEALVIDAATGYTILAVMVIVIPLAFIAVGLVIWIRRRKR